MNWYSITTRRIRTTKCTTTSVDEKHDNVNTNDDVDNWTTQHPNDCVALHNVHIHKQFHWACARRLVPCTFHHTHIGSSLCTCPARHSICMDIHVSVLSSPSSPLFLLPSFLPVLLPLPLLPPQRRAAARSSTRRSWKTCANPRYQRGWGAPTTSSTSPQVMSPRPMISTSSRTHQSSLSFKIPAAATRMWMTWHSARCSLKHTEDKSITSYKKACQSVSRRQ